MSWTLLHSIWWLNISDASHRWHGNHKVGRQRSLSVHAEEFPWHFSTKIHTEIRMQATLNREHSTNDCRTTRDPACCDCVGVSTNCNTHIGRFTYSRIGVRVFFAGMEKFKVKEIKVFEIADSTSLPAKSNRSTKRDERLHAQWVCWFCERTNHSPD
jgi:hypothetical protein